MVGGGVARRRPQDLRRVRFPAILDPSGRAAQLPIILVPLLGLRRCAQVAADLLCMKMDPFRTSLDVRLRVAGRVGSAQLQHDVPLAFTGAEWKALGAQLSPDGRMTLRTLYAYVSQLVDRDLRQRGIESEPLCVREYQRQLAEVRR